MAELKQFTRISNRILEALYEKELSKTEIRLLLCVARKTYGVFDKAAEASKKAERFSSKDLSSALKIDDRDVRRTIRDLVDRKILRCYEEPKGNRSGSYGLEKKIEKWDKPAVCRGKSPRGKSPRQTPLSGEITPGENPPTEEICRGVFPPASRGVFPPANFEQTVVNIGPEPSYRKVERSRSINKHADHVDLEAGQKEIVRRLEKLHRLALPTKALDSLAVWFSQNHPRQLLEAWLNAGLTHVEQRQREGAKLRQPYVIAFQEAERARDNDRHDRYGLPRSIWRGQKVYRNAGGLPVSQDGLELTAHPDHPDSVRIYRDTG